MRGLYYRFFTTFGEEYYAQSESEFQKAALLAPKNPIPEYLLGELQMKSSFWTKKAWASDAARDQHYRSAIAFYTKAIALNPRFKPAYAARAVAYLDLKQYESAIRDFGRVLELDPENTHRTCRPQVAEQDTMALMSLPLRSMTSAMHSDSRSQMIASFPISMNIELTPTSGTQINYQGSRLMTTALRSQGTSEGDVLLDESYAEFRILYPELGGRLRMRRYLAGLSCSSFEPQASKRPPSTRCFRPTRTGTRPYCVIFTAEAWRCLPLQEKKTTGRAILDFQRIYAGIPQLHRISTERWRALMCARRSRTYAIDVRGSDILSPGAPHVWVKDVRSLAARPKVTDFGINCGTRRIQIELRRYLVRRRRAKISSSSSDYSSAWSSIIPDSIGEALW